MLNVFIIEELHYSQVLGQVTCVWGPGVGRNNNSLSVPRNTIRTEGGWHRDCTGINTSGLDVEDGMKAGCTGKCGADTGLLIEAKCSIVEEKAKDALG